MNKYLWSIILGINLCVWVSNMCIYAQSQQYNVQLLEQSLARDLTQYQKKGKHYNNTYANNNANVLETKSKHWFIKYNPVSLALKGSMFVYQNAVSPQLGTRCLYELSCSNFSKQSLKEFGMVKGVFLTADRLLRCNKISMLDLHPMTFNEKSGRFIDNPSLYRVKRFGVDVKKK